MTAQPGVTQAPVKPGLRPEAVQQPGYAPSAKAGPRLEAVAETRLLMEGLNQSNYRGLQKLLRQEPGNEEAWAFIRGQALLIAETGNLLMLRPPHNSGEAQWLERSVEMRTSATHLAKAAAGRDYVRSRLALAELANVCNRCHQSFRIPARVNPSTEEPKE